MRIKRSRRGQSLAPLVLRIPTGNLSLGLRKDIPEYMVPPNGLIDCHNVWINKRCLEVVDGWIPWEGRTTPVPDCQGPMALVDELNLLSGTNIPIFGTAADLYRRSAFGELEFITPNYTTGTVTATNGSKTVTGSGTGWSSSNVVVGHRITIQGGVWYTVADIDYPTQTITLDRNYEGTGGSGLSYEVRMTYRGVINTKWSAEVFKDHFLFIEPGTFLQEWDGNADHRATTVVQYSALGVFTFKERPIIYSTVEGGVNYQQRIRWPDAGTYDSWTVQVGSEAGYMDLTETPDWIMAAARLSDYGVIYKERSIHMIAYVGLPYVFQRREIVSGVGLLGPKALVNLGSEHIFMGPDNFYVFDGSDVERIGDPVWREVFDVMDP